MAIGENIRRLREAREMTQEQLAERIGVTRPTVTQWETGWSQPRMGKVEQIAAALGVEPMDLLSDDQTLQQAVDADPVLSQIVHRYLSMGSEGRDALDRVSYYLVSIPKDGGVEK